MIALSEELRGMKSLTKTLLLRQDPSEVWTTLGIASDYLQCPNGPKA